MKNLTFRTTFSLAAIAAVVAATVSVGKAQSLFATLNVPVGVVTDGSGNVFVESVPANPFAPMQTTKFSPYGGVLAKYTTGSINGSRFSFDPGAQLFWAMQSSGQIRLMDPKTGAVANYLNLRQLPIDTSHIYNVNTGVADNFAGIIKTYSSWYGDIAVLRRGARVDVFVSGVSDIGSIPFVVRIRILPGPVSAQMILATTAPTLDCAGCGTLDRPRGVATSPAGTVLTTLPVTNAAGASIDVAFAVAADFDPVSGANPPRPILGGIKGKGLRAEGAASDDTGRFFVAADLGSTTLYCGLTVGAGALMIPATLDSVTCLGGMPNVTDRGFDVAATASGDAVYLTAGNIMGPQGGSVLKFTNTSSPNCNIALNPTSRNHGDGAETGSIAVTAAGGCTWAASPSAQWITITAGVAGNGNGTVSYALAANPNNTARQGTITVAGKTFTVYQAPRLGASCTYSLGAASTYMNRYGGGGALTINTAAGCPWTATTDVGWISVTSAKTGAGSVTLSYNVAQNNDGLTRIGWLKVAGQSFQITQFNF